MGCQSSKTSVAMGATPIFTGEDYRLEGKVDDDAKAGYEGMMAGQSMVTREMMTDEFIQTAIRGNFASGTEAYKQPIFDQWQTGFSREDVQMGGAQYCPGTVAQSVIIHRVQGTEGRKGQAAFVYYHGGGAVGGDNEQNIPICNRVAKQGDAVVFNCNYRLAPEHPAPAGIEDAYSVLKNIIADAAKYGVDPKKICIYGESGGGYITAGVSVMLSEKKEGHLVKLAFMQIPMVDDFFLQENPSPPFNQTEQAALNFQRGVYDALMKGGNARRPYISQAAMGDAICQGCPPALILTTEFDMYRRCAENLADVYRRNNRLIELGILKGVQHGAYFDFAQKRTDEWFNIFAKIRKNFLC